MFHLERHNHATKIRKGVGYSAEDDPVLFLLLVAAERLEQRSRLDPQQAGQFPKYAFIASSTRRSQLVVSFRAHSCTWKVWISRAGWTDNTHA